MISLDDTIAALASASGSAARGIVRVSGTAAPSAVDGLMLALPRSRSAPRRYSGELTVARLGRPVPADVYLWPTVRSYTGQPLAEFHTVGSPPILEAILADLFGRGIRQAQPGEFTLRAFLAGRVDLTQAEAVLGVIDARDERELQTALNQMAGGLSSQLLRLRGDLLDLLADLEAGLDFSDEAIEFVSHAALIGRLGLVRDAVSELLHKAERRMRPLARPRVVLAGAPNAGKSTLFNALAGGRKALVSEVAGTTRDYLAVEIEVAGMAVELVDTAGHAPAVDGIDREAQILGWGRIEGAAVVVWCRAADQSADLPDLPRLVDSAGHVLRIMTKGDLGDSPRADEELAVSAATGAGLKELASVIAARLSCAAAGDAPLLGTTAARSFDSLRRAQQALDRALEIVRGETDQELLAIEVREALDELGKIAGAVYTDDLLDRIFSKFCIGK